MELSVISFEVKESVAIIKMNNSPVNALTPEFLKDFEKIIKKIANTKKIRAALLASDCPGFFSAGDDLDGLKDINDDLISLLPKVHTAMNAFESLEIPTIAAINGHALGGGLELALTCDFRFMGEDCGRIGLPEVRLGMIPAFGGTQRLPLVVGKTKAIEMMFKGLQITSEQACQMGLVNEVFSQEDLFDKSFDRAKRLALQATKAIAMIKKCVNTGLYQGFEKGIEMEQKAFKANIYSNDVKEGVDAFLSGRKPEFKGN